LPKLFADCLPNIFVCRPIAVGRRTASWHAGCPGQARFCWNHLYRSP
jgi:hypothetical protein